MGGGAGAGVQGGVAALQMVEAKNMADAQRRAAEFSAQQLEFNAQLVSMQKNDVMAQAGKDIDYRQLQTKQMIGAQKVALAGQGIEVEGELAAELEKTERFISMQDVQALKNNAWRETMGLDIKASDLRSQAGFTRLGGKSQARNTLVTGGLGAASTAVSAYDKFQRG